MDIVRPALKSMIIVVDTLGVKSAVALLDLANFAAGPQKIESLPQLQLVESQLDDSDGQRPRPEAIGVSSCHDRSGSEGDLFNDSRYFGNVMKKAE
jgi:hypothetical protein